VTFGRCGDGIVARVLGCLERDNFDRHRSTACAAGCFRTILTDCEAS